MSWSAGCNSKWMALINGKNSRLIFSTFYNKIKKCIQWASNVQAIEGVGRLILVIKRSRKFHHWKPQICLKKLIEFSSSTKFISSFTFIARLMVNAIVIAIVIKSLPFGRESAREGKKKLRNLHFQSLYLALDGESRLVKSLHDRVMECGKCNIQKLPCIIFCALKLCCTRWLCNFP